MTDDLAPYFETRETRIGRLPVDARSKFEEAEKSATTTGQADFADRQFVSLWLSRRTGLPRKDIVANFDAIAGRYFGDGTTAAAAWDKIAANYKSAGAGAGESQPDQPQGGEASADAEYADTEGLPKVGAAALLENTAQSGRAAAGGFEGFAQRIPAGLYSQAAAVTGAPRLVDPMTIPEYVDLKRQNERILEPYSRAAVYDEAMSFGPVPTAEEEELIAKNEKRMAELARGLDNENREAVKQWAESPVSEVSEEYRRLAGFWYDLSAHAQDRWGVDPEFQKTTLGQFAASAGSVPATAALAVLGVGGAVAMEGAFFADVEQERAQAEGVAYDPDKAFGANLASALPQMALEKAFGVERLMNDVLGELPKMAGKVRFGDFAKTFVRRGLTAGAEEALTEPTQGFWNDYMASLTYDEQRETLTGDGAKRRLIESVSGFALGFVFGGGISAVQTVDQNRAVKAGAEYLTTKDGQVMTAADFRVLRTVKSDADISATAPDEETGRLLIAAANGDASAQQAYNSRVMATLFKPTDDIPVQGMALGMVNNVPVVKMADGVIVPLDLTNAEDRSFLDNFKREAVRVEALTQTVNFLRKGVEAGRDVQVSEEERTLADFIKEGHLDVTTAAQRMGIAEDVNGAQIPEGTNPADVRVLGTNLAEYRDGVFRDVSTIYQGGNALTAVEEVAEGYVKKRMAVGDLVEDDLTRWREKYENDTGDKTATTGRVSNIEWFSKRVVDYAVANRKLANMPKSWGAFLRTLGEHLKTVIRMSERMKKLLRGGKVEADFEAALRGALGLSKPEALLDSARKRRMAELEEIFAQGKPDAAARESRAEYELLKKRLARDAEGADIAIARAQAESEPAFGIDAELSPQAQRLAEAEGYDDITFAQSGIPQNSQQALSAQAQRLRAKKLAATGQLIARINAGIPLPAKAKAVRASTQASLLSRLAAPINTRLREISPELAQRLRRFEFDLGQAIKRDFDTAEPFLRGIEAMSKGDAAILDLALKNGDTDNRDAILVKYNLTQEFAAVDAMITATGQRAEAAGYTIVKLDDYFPRKVNDVDGLMMHYYGKPQMGAVEKALHDAARAAADQGRALTIEERQEIVNTVLRGYKPPEYRPRHVKQRSTEVVDVDANRFYADSAFALVSYIEAMNTAIEKRRFFGKFAVPLPAAAPGVTSSRIALDASIGAYIEDLIAAGQITRAQQAEVTSVLEARFQQTASSEFIKAFKSLSYMATMGQITSAMTQVSDLAFSLYENGVFNTMVAAGEAVTRQSAVTREALGLDAIAEEFREVGKLHRILNGVFKGVGIHYLDSIGKETLINAKFRQMQREVQAGRLSAKTTRLLQTSFTPAEQSQVIADLRAGKQTADTLFTVYSVLADYQPINASEYPEYYLRHPNGRIFYMLKSFTLKQFDAFRRESISLIVKGSAKQKVTGFRNLIHLAGLLYIIGVPVDWLKDWIMGRDTQLGDVAVDNVFKLLGVNRYNLWRFRESGSLIEAALLWAAPPAPFIEGPARDIMSSAGKIAEGDDIEPGEFESWRMLPFVGAPIYWWFGGGATKTEKRKAKERKSSGRSRIRES